jgi:CRP/FNR family transcriptional regulator
MLDMNRNDACAGGETLHARHAPPELDCRACGAYGLCVPLGLEAADMSLLERVVRGKQTYRRGEILFCTGEPFTYLYAIRSGSVKTFVGAEDGRVQVTGLRVPGELLGLSGIGPKSYTCGAIALESSSICKIAMDRLDEVAAKLPAIHHQMLRIMSTEIMHDEKLMLLLGARSADERLAAFLLELSARFAKRNFSATRFNLTMSRADIGNYLGLAEETICRVLARFQKQGLITFKRRQIELKDLSRLRGLATRPALGTVRTPGAPCAPVHVRAVR